MCTSKNQNGISYRFKKFLKNSNFTNSAVAVLDGHDNVTRDRKVSRLDIHSLRHTFAAIAGIAGVPLNSSRWY